MNYNQPELRKKLAGAYVLGTLRGSARTRFKRLLTEQPALAEDVRWWEVRLSPLLLRIDPVAPPNELWPRIADMAGLSAATPSSAPRQTAPARRRSSERLWRNWALLATAASILLVVGIIGVIRTPTPVQPQYVAFLQVPKSTMHWTISMSPDRQRLAVVSGGTPPPATNGKDAELWWIGSNGKPVALGVLPKHGNINRTLPADVRLQPQGKLAVSIEPLGGSPTGQPTGPVILAVPVTAIS